MFGVLWQGRERAHRGQHTDLIAPRPAEIPGPKDLCCNRGVLQILHPTWCSDKLLFSGLDLELN